MHHLKPISIWVAACIFLTFLTGSSSLKCYKCIALSCPDESTHFCRHVKSYVLKELKEIYYFYDVPTTYCPDATAPEAENAWEELKSLSPSSCGEEKDGEATCVLGRFRVTTFVTDLNVNVTSYGTSLGCAKRKLLEFAKKASQSNECDLSTSVSPIRDSLRHSLEIEHCSMNSDMCMDHDYCISPRNTVVKSFNDGDKEKPNYAKGIIIGVVVFLAFCIMILFFVGFKHG